MKIFPAIDLKDNKCVRLTKGQDSTSVVFNPNPIEQAKYFEDQGCERLHLIDLDSAFGRTNIKNNFEKLENPVPNFLEPARFVTVPSLYITYIYIFIYTYFIVCKK